MQKFLLSAADLSNARPKVIKPDRADEWFPEGFGLELEFDRRTVPEMIKAERSLMMNLANRFGFVKVTSKPYEPNEDWKPIEGELFPDTWRWHEDEFYSPEDGVDLLMRYLEKLLRQTLGESEPITMEQLEAEAANFYRKFEHPSFNVITLCTWTGSGKRPTDTAIAKKQDVAAAYYANRNHLMEGMIDNIPKWGLHLAELVKSFYELERETGPVSNAVKSTLFNRKFDKDNRGPLPSTKLRKFLVEVDKTLAEAGQAEYMEYPGIASGEQSTLLFSQKVSHASRAARKRPSKSKDGQFLREMYRGRWQYDKHHAPCLNWGELT